MTTLATQQLAWVMILVDRSASMLTIQEPAVAGLNRFVQVQSTDASTRLSIVQFGTSPTGGLEMTTMYDSVMSRSGSRAIEPAMYRPRGDTPLLSAVMAAITRMESLVRPEDRALLVIQTDGLDNASDVSLSDVRRRIEAKQRAGNWTFVYLGTELDEWHCAPTGQDMGIGPFHSLSWSPTSQGVTGALKTTSDAVDRWRKDTKTERFYPLQLPAPKQSRTEEAGV